MAAGAVAAGCVIAYPTEAVYGLGCDPLDWQAVRRILEIKGRSARKGLILIAADFAALAPFVESLDPERMAALAASWPGPTTWLLPARAATPQWLTGGRDTLAVRIPGHALARDLCHAWGGALVSTSANRHARPPARTALEVRRRLGDAADLVLVAPCGGHSRPSSIRDGRTGRTLRG